MYLNQMFSRLQARWEYIWYDTSGDSGGQRTWHAVVHEIKELVTTQQLNKSVMTQNPQGERKILLPMEGKKSSYKMTDLQNQMLNSYCFIGKNNKVFNIQINRFVPLIQTKYLLLCATQQRIYWAWQRLQKRLLTTRQRAEDSFSEM